MTPRVRRYAKEIGAQHGVPASEILGRSRFRQIVRARADVMRRLRADGFSLLQIGMWMKRDHTTVLHHIRANSTKAGESGHIGAPL
jgi:chromosomal replication initiation ATPase DnaA